MKNWKKISLRIGLLAMCVLGASPAHAMHIAEGFLPAAWCGVWYLLCLPFFIWGYYGLKVMTEESPRSKILLGIAGGFAFLLSALKAPSVGGSSSHLTGTGLGTFLFREIVLGPQAGEFFVVKSGLQVGEEVAINGVFKIDAAAQLIGLPSMMNPQSTTSTAPKNQSAPPISATKCSAAAKPTKH